LLCCPVPEMLHDADRVVARNVEFEGKRAHFLTMYGRPLHQRPLPRGQRPTKS
jgi:hypothetical protein